MQTLDIIAYSQNSAAAGSEYRPADKPKHKEAFSDVLDQQVSQGQNDANSSPQQEETPAEKKPEIENLAALLWLSQNPLATQKPVANAANGQVPEAAAAIPLIKEPQTPQQQITGETKELPQNTAETPVRNHNKNGEAALTAETGKIPTGKETTVPVDLKTEAQQETKPTGQMQEQKPAVGEATVNNTSRTENSAKAEPTAQGVSENKPSPGQGEQKAADVAPEPQPVAANEQRVFSEPVKTAQATGPETPQSKADLPSLTQTIMDQVAKGKKEFEIWLQPANLGKMAIKVAYESGKAAVSIICTNEKTMELISQNAKNLGTILEQHTGTQTVVVVDKPEADYLQQQTGQQEQGKDQQDANQADQPDKEKDPDSLSFLQQLRLGLA